MELRLCVDCGRLSAPGRSRCAHCGGAIRIDDARALLGRDFGRYRLIDVIGAGGMGIVYLAEHAELARLVALKLLLPELDQQAFVERFRREARILATLRHRHIVGIHDFDVVADGVPFYVMERLDGCSLAEALHRVSRPLALDEIAGIVVEVAKALDHAHRQRVVHRDLKPDNVFLAIEDGVVVAKLLDFGIAKHLDLDQRDGRLTSTGAVMGTPLYLTPEQMTGDDVGPATDQFALALIVAECLLGRPVRQGQTLTQMLKQAMQGATTDALADMRIPETVRTLLQTATAFDPAQRHADVATFAAALRALSVDDDRRWLDVVTVGARSAIVSTFPTIAATTPPPVATTPPPVRGPNVATTPFDPMRSMATSIVTPHAEPAVATRRQRWLVIASIVAVIGTGLAWWYRGDPIEPAATSANAPASLLHVGVRHDTPADAGKLLGVIDAGAVLETAGGIYLHPLQGTTAAARQTLAPGEDMLGVASESGVLLRSGDRVLDRDVKGARERVVGARIGSGRVLGVDAQGTRFVVGDDDELRLVDADGTRVLASVPRERLLHARMGREQLLAVLSAPHELRLIDLREDRVLWTAPLSGARLYDLAWLEDSGDIAACGFSPQVELFNARRGAVARRVDVPVSCYAAHWLADGPSLVIRAERALLLWRDGVQTRIEWPHAAGAIDSVLPNIVAAADRLWIGEPASSALFELRLGGDAPVPLHRQSFGEIWDVQASKDAVYVGAADGALWRVSANDAQRFAVHDAGITDIIDGGDAIATASDDRTVAVWQPPAMSIRWRTRGHDFLVNQLWLSAARDALWSSSSDGSVKRWRWPDLDVEETVDVRALTGRKDLSLHAIWLDRMATQILLGSWNHQLVHLRRGETGWQARNFAVAGAGGYRFQEVPEAQAVVVLTTMPTRLYAWDLQQDRLIAMPDFDLSLLALAAGRTATSVFAAGPGVVIEQHLRRDADGSLRFDATTRQISALGAVTAASIDPARSCWVVAAQGQVLCIPWSWFEPSRH